MADKPSFKWISIALMVGVVTLLHYGTTIHKPLYHDIFQRLYYFPIIFAGFWFGLKGGLLTSLTISIIYAPHILFQWKIFPSMGLEKYLELILYNTVGGITGFLAERLRASHSKLQEQADTIMEIEEQLRRADRLSSLGELSAGLAHEIRNPLSSIKGTAEIFKDKLSPSDSKYEFAEILLKEVNRLNRVVENFLRFAKSQPVKLSEFSISEILDPLLGLVAVQAKRQNIIIQTQLATDLPNLKVDGEKLRQVLLNIILNALQAMPSGGLLKINATKDNNSIVISVLDTGSGIPKENFQEIFTPFFTTKSQGAGLGLAISRRIIDQLNGSISVSSEEGKGTTFVIKLPI